MAIEQNSIQHLLIALGICDESSLEPYYPQVRDREDIAVLRCKKSGVMVLSSSEHMHRSYYAEKTGFQYWSAADRKHAVNLGHEDTLRRKQLLQPVVANRTWMDVGTGAGGLLDELSGLAARVLAVEPQTIARESLRQLGYAVYPDLESVPEADIDVVTLFHVFEHLPHPLEDLRQIYQRMGRGGRLLLEVPHANDFLLAFLNHEGFKKFTFWSEHLCLHTRHSLNRCLEAAGFEDIVVKGCQRYPLANHLHWLSQNQPGGHQKWSFLRTTALDEAYAQMLAQIDQTDTLIAIAQKP